MGSFACPHYDTAKDGCLRLKTDCVPGRRGCVLRDKSVFAFSAEERVRELEKEKKTKPSRRRR
ncbi:MAG: hypothetical protein NT105_06925 [Verrucomicrobia bacterium]|nr:hypothetical protein [Verrucomicrobiota bacterium]